MYIVYIRILCISYIYVYTYMSWYIYIYVYMYACHSLWSLRSLDHCAPTHMCIYIYIRFKSVTHLPIFICLYIFTSTSYVCAHTYTHIHVYIHTYALHINRCSLFFFFVRVVACKVAKLYCTASGFLLFAPCVVLTLQLVYLTISETKEGETKNRQRKRKKRTNKEKRTRETGERQGVLRAEWSLY